MLKIEANTKLRIPAQIITETEQFLRQKGQCREEGRVYWIGELIGPIIKITRLHIPEQISESSIWGVSVEVRKKERLAMMETLQGDERVFVKLHSHPQEAYMSETDIRNPSFKHEGAISIVVPNFSSNPMGELLDCSVNIFTAGEWRELTREMVSRFVEVQYERV